jgi:hypothetical protein
MTRVNQHRPDPVLFGISIGSFPPQHRRIAQAIHIRQGKRYSNMSKELFS